MSGGHTTQALQDYAKVFPSIEFSFPVAQLPDLEFVGKVESVRSLTPTWRITVTDMEEDREYFTGQAWSYFIQALDAEHNMLILALERTCEYTMKDLEFLQQLVEDLFPLPCFLEFEHHSWRRAARALQAAKIPIVQHDAPDLPGIIKDIPCNSKRAYLRLLGRDKRTWFEHIPSERFVYKYNSTELSEIADRVRALRAIAGRVTVMFGTYPPPTAFMNASMVMGMVR